MVKNLLSILTARQNSILSGASILMVAVFASKFLGLIRDRLLVHNFSSSDAAIFFAAFRLPDLLFNLLIFGALSVAFIPVFTEHLHKNGEKDAFDFAVNILNLSLVLFGSIAALAFLFAPFLNSILIPGFSGSQKTITDELSRVILLGQIILVVGAFFVGISQSYQRFIIPSLAPLFYNLGVIIGIYLSPVLGIRGPAFGVVIGAAFHVLVQFPLVVSLGFKYKFSLNFFNSGVREVIRLMSFRNIGLAIEQLNETVGLALSSLISYSSVTLLTFAQHLQTVPIGLFGATIAQAALPVLSKEISSGDTQAFKLTLLTTLHQILFLTLPATAILIVLRIPVVRLVFGASQFTWSDTVLTGRTLALMSLGLSAQAIVLLIVRGFYAIKDTKSPVFVSLVTVFLNLTLSLSLILLYHMDVSSLGLSYSISSLLSCLLLIKLLERKVGRFDKKLLINPALKMFLASSIAALALYLPIKALDKLVFDTTKTANLLILTLIASFFGLLVYIAMVYLMKVKELETFTNLIRKFYSAQNQVKTQELIKETGTI